VQYGSGRGYGIAMIPWASGNLIENSLIYHTSTGFTLNGSISGNVIAYNYVHTLYYIDNSWNREGIFTHGSWPFMNLYEGNIVEGVVGADDYHGPSAYNTIFRNYIYPVAGRTNTVWSIALASHSQYHNVVGNVLGNGGNQNVYEGITFGGTEKAIYELSYQGGSDSAVKSTLLRHGNWDSATNGIVWDPTISDHTIPNSLYLTSKPSWWGNLPWPAIGPDLNPMAGTIPAEARYNGQSYPYGSNDTTPPDAPTGLVVN